MKITRKTPQVLTTPEVHKKAEIQQHAGPVTAGQQRGPALRPVPGKKLVRLAGLEPARLSPLPPQSSVSANSTISALGNNEAALRGDRKGIFTLPVIGIEFSGQRG